MQYLSDIVGLAALGWPLTLLVVIAIFFAISIVVAVQVSKRTKRKALWGWGIVSAAYLLVFWDHIPTILVHKYYCKKEAGFWVYKTRDQWKAENPGVMEGLEADKNSPSIRVGDDENHIDTQILNPRFRWATEKQRPSFLLPVYRWKREITDSKSGGTVSRHVDFSAGKGKDNLKFWTNIKNCPNGTENRNAFYRFVESFVNISKRETE